MKFGIGNQVLRRNRVLSSRGDNFAAKQAPLYVGPVVILKELSPASYLVGEKETGKKWRVQRYVAPSTSPNHNLSSPVTDGAPEPGTPLDRRHEPR